MRRPNHPYQECPKMKCLNCNGFGHNKWNRGKIVCFKCQKLGHYSFEFDMFHHILITAHPGRTPEKIPTYSHPSRALISYRRPTTDRPGSVDDAVDAIGEFMEDYSADLEELQRLDLPERKDIDNKTS